MGFSLSLVNALEGWEGPSLAEWEGDVESSRQVEGERSVKGQGSKGGGQEA